LSQGEREKANKELVLQFAAVMRAQDIDKAAAFLAPARFRIRAQGGSTPSAAALRGFGASLVAQEQSLTKICSPQTSERSSTRNIT
jgi:hypothetical protein